MRTKRGSALCLATALACAAATPLRAQDAQTSDIARAESFAAAGFEAYERRDYAGAVALYEQALHTVPSADILYNLARIHDAKLKDRRLAIEYYRRYTLDTGADPNRLRAASLRLAELAKLEAIATETPAQRDAGPELRQPPTPAGTPTTAAGADGLSGLQVAGLVTGGIGVAALGSGFGFGIAAKAAADVAHEFCDGNACRTQRGVDAAKAASRSATVATVALITGCALAALGVAFVVAGVDGEPTHEEAGLSLAPYAGAGAVGTYLASRF